MSYIIGSKCVSVCDTACVNVCPVDCIYEVDSDVTPQKYVGIDLDTCIGCELCVRATKKKGVYDLKVCPWDAIEMHQFKKVHADVFTAWRDAAHKAGKGRWDD